MTTSSAAEASCQRLIVAFAHHVDHREFAEAANLFAHDGIWDRHGERLVGPSRIHAVLESRPSTQLERHVMTTIHVIQQSPTECSAISYVLIFRASAEPGQTAVVPGPSAVGEFHDRFRFTDGEWKLAYRTSVTVFTIESR